MWKPGCKSQDLVARMWERGFGSQDLVARMLKPGSGSEIDEKILFYKKSELSKKNNDSRNSFVDIGLENVALAPARVVEGPSRSSL